MNHVEMSDQRLIELIQKFSRSRIAVVGDFFLDKYLEVDPNLAEQSLETAKTAHQVVDVRCSPGAAGTIVSNLTALGAGRIDAVGFAGNDGEGHDLRNGLAQLQCHTDHLHASADRRTPTYLKPRDTNVEHLEAEHSRYDTKNRTATPPVLVDHILDSIDELLPRLDALIVMDQVEEPECGVVTTRVRSAICEMARQHDNIIFWADSRRRIVEFPGLIIKPNQFEAVDNTAPSPQSDIPIDVLRKAAQQLRTRNKAPVMVTRGESGMLVSDPQWTIVPGVQVTGPTDPTGAGDSTTAGAALALCAGASLPEAALLGCLVASITVQQIGTTGVAHADQLIERLALWQSQQE